jgi:hypothetical protein
MYLSQLELWHLLLNVLAIVNCLVIASLLLLGRQIFSHAANPYLSLFFALLVVLQINEIFTLLKLASDWWPWISLPCAFMLSPALYSYFRLQLALVAGTVVVGALWRHFATALLFGLVASYLRASNPFMWADVVSQLPMLLLLFYYLPLCRYLARYVRELGVLEPKVRWLIAVFFMPLLLMLLRTAMPYLPSIIDDISLAMRFRIAQVVLIFGLSVYAGILLFQVISIRLAMPPTGRSAPLTVLEHDELDYIQQLFDDEGR